MKKNTIKGYLGGGKINPMGYQGGGYIPGISRSMYGMGLQRDVVKAQKDFEKQARKVQKEQDKRGLFSKLGSMAGTALGAALAPATGGLSLIAAKGIGSALGSGLGEMAAGKMYDAGDIKKSSTGLFGEDFSDLAKLESDMEKGGLGRALGAGASTALMAGVGELGKMGAGSLSNKLFKGKQAVTGTGSLGLDTIKPEGVMPESFGGKGLTGGSQGFSLSTPSLNIPNISSDVLGTQYTSPEEGILQGLIQSAPEQTQLSFGDLFKQARQEGLDEFMYQGNPYTTELAMPSQRGGMIEGASPYSAKMSPKGEFQQIMSVPASEVGEGEGLRYYLGEAVKPQLALAKKTAQDRAMVKMQTTPQDSIPSHLVDNYFSEEEEVPKKGIMSLLGFKGGGQVGGYGGGIGLLSMMPLNRRIV